MIRTWVLFILLACFAKAHANIGNQHAVILMYHHVSEETPASTSVSPKQFAEHMQYLADHHHVMALPTLINHLQQGKGVPNNTVAITFDDGFNNIAENGHPILRKHGFPYTIFINPDLVGTHDVYLSWQTMQRLQKQDVTFANHTSTHKHLLLASDEPDWLSKTMQDINNAESQITQQLGSKHKLVAYPYGEYNQQLSEALRKKGYVGFGQHSGAVSTHSDFGALPRFPAAGIYANLDTLKVKLSSLDMPIISKAINQPQLTFADRRPQQHITIDPSDIREQQLQCYFGGKQIPVERQDNRVAIPLTEDLPVGRSRVNCTAPSQSLANRYYWFSQPWFVPTEQNTWLD